MPYRLLLLGIFLISLSLEVFAQKLKYKDIYPIIQAKKYPLAYKKLKLFLSQDPENANTLYQLGRISDYRAAGYDVLTQGNLALRYADSCIFYFQKALVQIDEKELRKNGEYYEEFQIKNPSNPDKFTFNLPDIQKKLSERIAHYTQFRDNLPQILRLFYASIRNYDEAVKIFDRIIRQYPTLKEFYLLAGDSTITDLRRLRLTSDSAAYYLAGYKEAIQKYPIQGYSQNYQILPIQTYRLDGIVSQVDFLQANIILWNYGEWVNSVLKVLEGDISQLRSQTHQLNSEMETRLQKLENSTQVELADYEPSRKTLLLLEKYDYDSWLYHWLSYQKTKLDFYKVLKSQPDSMQMLVFENKLRYYHDNNRELKILQLAYQNLKANSSDEKMKRHIRFLERNYNSTANYLKLLNREDELLKAYDSETKKQLSQTMIERYKLQNNPEKFLIYQTDKIAAFEQSLEYLTMGEINFVTLVVRKDLEGNQYVAGSYRNKEKMWTGFVAKFTAKDKLEWFKPAKAKIEGVEKTASLINCLELNDRGCLFIETYFEPETQLIQQNQLLEVDSKGKNDQVFNLSNLHELPRQLFYNFDNAELLLLVKGKNALDYDQKSEEVSLLKMSQTGEIVGQTYFELLGKPAEFIQLKDGVLLVGSFAMLKAIGRKDLLSRAGKNSQDTNVFVMKIDSEGKIKNLKVLESDKPLSVTLINRVAEQTVYLICQKNTPQLKPYNLFENTILIEVSNEGEFVK
jgi:hypothetical protein